MTAMLEVNKDYTAMATNYQRRLSGTDKFLTTTTKEKRIEVKSDLLTEIYNNKIMKNIKELIKEFRNEAKKRIANGEFETVETDLNTNDHYIGDIKIKIDGLVFKFSLAKSNEVICDHSEVKIYDLYADEKEFRQLKKAYKEDSRINRDFAIKKLQDKIAELQK